MTNKNLRFALLQTKNHFPINRRKTPYHFGPITVNGCSSPYSHVYSTLRKKNLKDVLVTRGDMNSKLLKILQSKNLIPTITLHVMVEMPRIYHSVYISCHKTGRNMVVGNNYQF